MSREAPVVDASPRVDWVSQDLLYEGSRDAEFSPDRREVALPAEHAPENLLRDTGLGPAVAPCGTRLVVVHAVGEGAEAGYVPSLAPQRLACPHAPLTEPLTLEERDFRLHHHEKTVLAVVLGAG